MKDKFEKATEASLAALVKSVPVVGQVFEAAQAFFPDKTEQHYHALTEELHSHIYRLEDRVAEIEKQLRVVGKKVDDLGTIDRTRLHVEFVQAMVLASTDEARDAVTNAFARQLDPRMGPEALRRHWLTVVRGLSDAQLAAIRFLGSNEGNVYYSTENHQFWTGPEAKVRLAHGTREIAGLRSIELTDDDVTSYRAVLRTLVQPGGLVGAPQDQRWHYLTREGSLVYRLISDV